MPANAAAKPIDSFDDFDDDDRDGSWTGDRTSLTQG
jgi:hypothetical protein